MDSRIQFVLFVVTFATILSPTIAKLTPNYYDRICPKALPIIKSIVKQAIVREPRMGASLLRLHFHDCFVNVSLLIS
jgi:peroxidase